MSSKQAFAIVERVDSETWLKTALGLLELAGSPVGHIYSCDDDGFFKYSVFALWLDIAGRSATWDERRLSASPISRAKQVSAKVGSRFESVAGKRRGRGTSGGSTLVSCEGLIDSNRPQPARQGKHQGLVLGVGRFFICCCSALAAPPVCVMRPGTITKKRAIQAPATGCTSEDLDRSCLRSPRETETDTVAVRRNDWLLMKRQMGIAVPKVSLTWPGGEARRGKATEGACKNWDLMMSRMWVRYHLYQHRGC